jgi:hypothetical protein
MVNTINSSQGAFFGLSSPSRCEQVPSSTGHESSTSVTSNSKQTTKSLNFQDSYSNQDNILFNTNLTNKTQEDNNDSNTKDREQQPNHHYNYLQNAEVIANTARISTKTHTSSTLASRPTTTTYSAIHQENHNRQHDMINKIITTKMNNKGELVNSSSVPSPTTSSLMTSSQFDNVTTNTAKKLAFAPAPIMSPQLSLRFSSGGHGANYNSRCRSSSSISSSSSRESASNSRNQYYHNGWRGQEVEKETSTMLPPSPMLSPSHFSPSTSTQNDTSIKNNATTSNHNTIIANPVVPLLDMSKRNENQQSMMLDHSTNDTDIFKNAVVPPTSSTTTTKKSSTMLPLSLSSKRNHQDTNSRTLNYLISPVNGHQEHCPVPLPAHHDDNINNHTVCSFQPHHYHETQSIATMKEMERHLLLQNYHRQRELLLVQSSNDDQSSPSTTSPPNTTLNNGNTTNASTSSSHVSSIPLAINCSSPHPSPIYSCNIDKEILESKEYFIPPNLLINSNNNNRIKHSQSNNDSNAIAPASNHHSTVSDNDDYNNTRLSFETYLNRYHTPNIKEQEETVKARRFEYFTTRPYMPLSNHEDRRISPFLCFVGSECIEIFKADDIMVKSRACNKVMLHQIGIRCRFCAHYRNPRARSKRSSAFPSSTCRIYQTLNVMINEHLTICPEIPQDMKDKFVKLKASRASNKSTTSKTFWKTSAESVGMVNTEKGIGMINPLSLIFPSLASSSASSS